VPAVRWRAWWAVIEARARRDATAVEFLLSLAEDFPIGSQEPAESV
jgi:hypothetical protein